MSDYEIGYGKPPTATRFKPGKSGNPKGRPKRDKSLGSIVNEFFEETIEYRENGHARTVTRREFELILLVQQAINGDIGAAGILLQKRSRALRRGDAGSKQLLICDLLPDYPGQTAAKKARELGSAIGTQFVAVEDSALESGEALEREANLEHSGVTEASDEATD